MKSKLLMSAVGGISDIYIEEAEPGKKAKTTRKTTSRSIKWAMPVAACLVLAVVAATTLPMLNGSRDFSFEQSQGVKVSYVDSPPNVSSMAQLLYLTEEELFAPDWHGMEVVAFAGEVTKVENISISFGSEWHNKSYRAIATIEISEVFRGDLKVGDKVTVLLPAPVNGSIWVEDSSVSSQMTVGTRGIFMPAKYNDESIWEENGNTLYLQEIAEYGLLDGERWAFLDKPSGVVFAQFAYEGIQDATTMDEIKNYVIDMIK